MSTCWSGKPDYVERLEAEIEQLRARLNAKPTPEAILLQARKAEGGPWIDIFPAQLSWMAREGHEVRALERAPNGEETP